MHHLHGVDTAAPISQIQMHQSAGPDVFANHRFGHAAPSQDIEQQPVFGGYIANPPVVDADNAKIPFLALWALRKNKLHKILGAE